MIDFQPGIRTMEKIRYWDLPRVLLVICFVLLLLAPFIWAASIQRGGLWENLDFVLKMGLILLPPHVAAFLLMRRNNITVETDIEIHWGDPHRESPVSNFGWGILLLLGILAELELKSPFLVRWFGEGVFDVLFWPLVMGFINLVVYSNVRHRTSYAD